LQIRVPLLIASSSPEEPSGLFLCKSSENCTDPYTSGDLVLQPHFVKKNIATSHAIPDF